MSCPEHVAEPGYDQQVRRPDRSVQLGHGGLQVSRGQVAVPKRHLQRRVPEQLRDRVQRDAPLDEPAGVRVAEVVQADVGQPGPGDGRPPGPVRAWRTAWPAAPSPARPTRPCGSGTRGPAPAAARGRAGGAVRPPAGAAGRPGGGSTWSSSGGRSYAVRRNPWRPRGRGPRRPTAARSPPGGGCRSPRGRRPGRAGAARARTRPAGGPPRRPAATASAGWPAGRG